MNKVICQNCGAAIYENEAECPFCGYINIVGAEEKFMRDMKQTQKDMSQIPELQKEELRKSFSKSSKIIFITVGIVSVIALILFGVHMFFEKVLFSYSEPDPKAQMMWERENYPILDAMYEAGDYDGIIEFQYQLYDDNEKNDTQYQLYDWEHYYFINGYRRYLDVEEYISLLDRGEELSDYKAENLVYICMWFHYRDYATESAFMPYSEEEIEKLDEYREIVEGYFFGRLGFTQQEADELYEDALDEYGGLDMKTCWKYGRKVKDRFQ